MSWADLANMQFLSRNEWTEAKESQNSTTRGLKMTEGLFFSNWNRKYRDRERENIQIMLYINTGLSAHDWSLYL